MTIAVGESVNLFLKDADGNKILVEWTANKDGFVTIDGQKITGAAASREITLTATHDGESFKYIIRVTAPAQ